MGNSNSADDQRLCFHSIILPTNDLWTGFERFSFNLDLNKDNSLAQDVLWVETAKREAAYIDKQNKWDSVDLLGKFQGMFVKDKVKRDQLKGFKDYCYFPRLGHFELYLSELLKRNPFFASALGRKDDGTMVLDPTINATTSWYNRIVRTMDPAYSRFKAVINPDFSIGDIECIDIKGDPSNAFDVPPSGNVTPREYKILGLLVNLVFFAQVIHATLHVYHYCMTAAIEDSSRDSRALKEWATGYYQNVPNKYTQVKALLFNKGGALSGNVFISDHTELIQVATELLMHWGSTDSAAQFMREFIYAGLGTPPAGILEQFSAEAADIKQYADDLVKAFTDHNKSEVSAANASLRSFLTELRHEDGTPAIRFHTNATNVDALRSWIELMSITGLLHAGTFSFSRLMLSQPILALLRPGTTTFGELEIGTLALISGTILGIDEERAVYGNNDALRRIARNVHNVLNDYENRASTRRENYWNAIKQRPDIEQIGWILTDYCDHAIDNKQITKVTYV